MSTLESKTVLELRALCREQGLKRYSKLKKAELIALLETGEEPTAVTVVKDSKKGPTVEQLKARLTELGLKPPSLTKASLASYLEAIEASIEAGTYEVPRGKGRPEYELPELEPFDLKLLAGAEVDEDGLWVLGGTKGMTERLHKQGYLVVKVLETEQALEYRDRLLDWAMQLGPDFDVDDPSTWEPTKMPPTRHGIYKVGAHSPPMWDLRVEPAVLKLFHWLHYGDATLVSGFDGFNISPPLETQTKKGLEPENKCWIHSDHPNPVYYQHYSGSRDKKEQPLSYQLCLSLSDNGGWEAQAETTTLPSNGGWEAQAETTTLPSNGGGTVLLPDDGSSFDRVLAERPYLNYSWGRVDPAWLTDKDGQPLKAIQFTLPPGYGVVWHSKVWHQGSSPLYMRDDSEPRGASPVSEMISAADRAPRDSLRVAAYLSYGPRYYLNEKEREKRIKWFEQGKNTGHWTFGPWLQPAAPPRHYNRVRLTELEDLPRLTEEDLTPIQRQLVGYLDCTD